MSMPSVQAVGKAVLMTAVALVIINFAKPYLPDSVKSALGG